METPRRLTPAGTGVTDRTGTPTVPDPGSNDMDARSTHPALAALRPLHSDIDAVTPAALLDFASAFTGPAARAVESAEVRLVPAADITTPARTVTDPRTAPVPGEDRGRHRPSTVHLTAAVRRDGIRVLGSGPALLAGVSLGPALRVDLRPVPGGIVYVARPLVLKPLGDDDKGTAYTGIVHADELPRFWEVVLDQHDPRRPVIVHVRNDEDAAVLRLLRTLGPPGLRLVGYRLDASVVGTQRASYLLPTVLPEAVLEYGHHRVPLDEAPRTITPEGAAEDAASWRRMNRYLHRVAQDLHHNLSSSTPATVTDIYTDGSTLRGAKIGGAAATAAPGLWAARPVSGAARPLEAELEALLLGHLLAAWAGDRERSVVIHSDSRAALALLRDAVTEPLTLGDARGEGVRRTLRHLLDVRQRAAEVGRRISTVWIKGHAGHHGNEVADSLARSIARNWLAGTDAEETHRRLTRLAGAWEGHDSAAEEEPPRVA